MGVGELLPLLKEVREMGPSTWIAQCPAHDDHDPSLSIKESDGKILLYCHAGCPTEHVVSALGLTMADLFGDPTTMGRPKIAKEYDYRDEQGNLLFQVVRTEPKGFFQRRPDGHGGWVNDLKGVRRVLYRLPGLLAPSPHPMVFVVEGEKDVDRLAALGLVATTNPGGAGKWRAEYCDSLRGRAVFVIPDNDATGREHAEEVIASLTAAGVRAFTLDLPDLPEKGDVSDFLNAGHKTGDLLLLAARIYAKSQKGILEEVPGHYSDLGNAQRLVRLYGDDLRYCHDWQKWLCWDGRRWAIDQNETVVRCAKDTVISMYQEATKEGNGSKYSLAADHALRSAGEHKLRAMVKLARSEPDISISARSLDADPWMLNTLDGPVDLKTGKLRRLSADDFPTKLAPVRYDAEAKCLLWETFLDRILGGDAALISFVQRALGYTLTGSTREQVLFFLYGTGANGKSTFLDVVRTLLGDYAKTATLDTFIQKQRAGASNDIARLAGARLVTAQEVQGGARLDEALVKQLTGGDAVAARFLYAEHFEFKPTCKFFLAANHKPIIQNTDHAIWRRIRLIPFAVTIPAAEQDRDLVAKLKEELPGIFAWAVRGCLEWQEKGLGEPPAVTKATDDYRDESDFLRVFLRERCFDNPSAKTASAALYSTYVEWAKRNEDRSVSQHAFGRALSERGYAKTKTSGLIHWVGVALRDDGDDGDH